MEPARRNPPRFFIRHTATPEIGPIVKEASTAGTSEKSKLINPGIIGILNARNFISTTAIALSRAVNTSLRTSIVCFVFVVVLFMFSSIVLGKQKAPARTKWLYRGRKYARRSDTTFVF